jgi:hypothetical protein
MNVFLHSSFVSGSLTLRGSFDESIELILVKGDDG